VKKVEKMVVYSAVHSVWMSAVSTELMKVDY
jgi:hypothetical protein